MVTDSPAPLDYVPGGGYVDGRWWRNQGPVTGLAWGTEMVRLMMLERAAHADELAKEYADSEFGRGLSLGRADTYREAARELIRYAWWQE